jgi:CRP-like cAMP-binding protein
MDLRSLLVLLRNVKIRTFEKGEILIREGSTKDDMFFVRKGLVRSYYIDEKVDEITFQLYPETHGFGNVHSIFFNEPSKFTYQTLERTKVYIIDFGSFNDVVSKNPKLMEVNRVYLISRLMKQLYYRVESFVLLSPEERYRKYVKDHPNIINRAPDKYIANILGITPVSLSRIRNRIASKKTNPNLFLILC